MTQYQQMNLVAKYNQFFTDFKDGELSADQLMTRVKAFEAENEAILKTPPPPPRAHIFGYPSRDGEPIRSLFGEPVFTPDPKEPVKAFQRLFNDHCLPHIISILQDSPRTPELEEFYEEKNAIWVLYKIHKRKRAEEDEMYRRKQRDADTQALRDEIARDEQNLETKRKRLKDLTKWIS